MGLVWCQVGLGSALFKGPARRLLQVGFGTPPPPSPQGVDPCKRKEETLESQQAMG